MSDRKVFDVSGACNIKVGGTGTGRVLIPFKPEARLVSGFKANKDATAFEWVGEDNTKVHVQIMSQFSFTNYGAQMLYQNTLPIISVATVSIGTTKTSGEAYVVLKKGDKLQLEFENSGPEPALLNVISARLFIQY